nr:primosomal protein N' [Candidatus Krumholzibacteriota bacterium]
GAYQVLHRGVGTQRVEMELGNLLPRARVLRMDLDTTGGKRGHLEILERFGKGEADILLGTQMVAKGHHYPNVTVVGVLNADGGINFPDFRAAERTFHLLFQAAGRTGRGEKPGRVLVQAYSPTHYIFPYLVEHDFTGFADTELAVRRELDYPPASKLILFTLSSTSAERAMSGGTEVKKALDATGLVPAEKVLGPTPALIEKLRGRFRVQVLVKGELSPAEKKKLIGSASRAVAAYSPLDLRWNVDPLNMF